ncbi:MAG: hypothetical protein WCC27_07925 [Acidobacteriaceae bacterium]
MRRPAGVVVAAVVLGLMALMGIFGSLGSMAITIFMQGGPTMPAVPGMRAVMVLTTGLMFCFSLFCGWTVVGLFRMQRWARYSILALGGLEFLFCALLSGVMILVRNTPPPATAETASPIALQSMFLGLAAVYGVFSLIGAWWLVYFNLASVRAAFAGTGQPAMETVPVLSPGVAAQAPAGTPGWRIVIIAWACLMLFSIVGLPMVVMMHLPVFLFGVVLRGAAGTTLMVALYAVMLYMGIGLLKKWRAAWYAALAWQVYTVAVFLSFLAPGMWARMMAYEQELQSHWGFAITTPDATMAMDMRPFMRIGMVIGGVVGVAMVVVLTMALFKRREDYLGA